MKYAASSVALVVGVLLICGGVARAAVDGSRTKPVHRIPLFDENGEKIAPYDPFPMPFSGKRTCGDCHDYETIRLGWHFNAHEPDVPPGKPGEPWVLVDVQTGTQLPLSYRAWPGVWNPEQLGISPWRFTQLFARHMPGGDVGEPSGVPDVESRWDVSGQLEINCLGCHNVSPDQSQSDWVIQTARENFRWAATSAAGLGVVEGLASAVPDTWDLMYGPNPDNSYASPPSIKYSKALFDANNRVFFDLAREGSANRCEFCHSVDVVGTEPVDRFEDVHLTAGLTCTDCHRNGLAHDIVRGNETGAAAAMTRAMSCRGCHYGGAEAEGALAQGGLFRAPKPKHKSLPETHVNSIACTTCHSGPWSEGGTVRVRMSRANRLGVHGKARWDTELPLIVAPVFMKDADNKIAPHRMFWPAFWARVQGEKATPLLPEAVAQAAGNVLQPEKQVADILGALEPEDEPGVAAAYISGGKTYRRLTLNRLTAVATADMAKPYWALVKEDKIQPVVLDAFGWTAEVLLNPAKPLSEAQIAKVLGELEYEHAAAGDPVYIADGTLYRWTDEGKMTSSAAPEAHASAKLLWADLKDETVVPFDEGVVKAAVEAMLETEKKATSEKIAGVLEALASRAEPQCQPVYLSGDKLFSRNEATGGLDASERPADAPSGDVFWGWRQGDKILPLVPEYVTEAIASPRLTEAQVVRVLRALAQDSTGGEPGYVCGGKLHLLKGDTLSAVEHDAAKPHAWTFGHDVRPASQSLGVGGCADCHRDDAPFFYAQVTPESPAKLEQASALPMYRLEGYKEALLKGWVRSVGLRPLTVYGGLVAAGLIGFALLRYGFMGLEAVLRAFVPKKGKRRI